MSDRRDKKPAKPHPDLPDPATYVSEDDLFADQDGGPPTSQVLL